MLYGRNQSIYHVMSIILAAGHYYYTTQAMPIDPSPPPAAPVLPGPLAGIFNAPLPLVPSVVPAPSSSVAPAPTHAAAPSVSPAPNSVPAPAPTSASAPVAPTSPPAPVAPNSAPAPTTPTSAPPANPTAVPSPAANADVNAPRIGPSPGDVMNAAHVDIITDFESKKNFKTLGEIRVQHFRDTTMFALRKLVEMKKLDDEKDRVKLFTAIVGEYQLVKSKGAPAEFLDKVKQPTIVAAFIRHTLPEAVCSDAEISAVLGLLQEDTATIPKVRQDIDKALEAPSAKKP